ncbi:MAG: hypothetical protein A2076_12705 [Geobacteraceae bacterium GWC2_53_11]|nr:MAG: hypothetical protein A2076_12705 [Geobacteraceae bacterium GWC2_53_11]
MITIIRNVFNDLIGFNLKSKHGSAQWLINKEVQYGGIHKNVPRNKVSPYDPRSEIEIFAGGMTGGDRMRHHGYARFYEKYLRQYACSAAPITLVEVGILRGVGLSIWCDLFPNSRIVGLDIDLEHFRGNRHVLESKNAFMFNSPEIYEFDQFIDNRSLIGEIVGHDKIDIFIDDGFHSIESITITLNSVRDYLAENFVYFIEDNADVGELLINKCPEYDVHVHDELTVLTRKI